MGTKVQYLGLKKKGKFKAKETKTWRRKRRILLCILIQEI
jgi:hypothetical protein